MLICNNKVGIHKVGVMGGAVISKGYMIIGLVLGVLILIGGVSAAAGPSCGDTIAGDTTLDSDLTCAGTGLIIGADNITLDGAGYSITGNGSGNGVYLNGSSGVTVKNLGVNGFNNGIYLDSSSDNTLTNNTASNNTYGIWLDSSSNNTLTSNNASSNSQRGISLYSASDNTLTNNTASNNTQYGIYLTFSSNYNTFTDNNASLNSNTGIYLSSSSNYNTLTDNTASNNTQYGIYFSSSSYNTISGGTINDNSNFGAYVYSSSNITVTGVEIHNNANYGIYDIAIVANSYQTFSNNQISCGGSGDGIYMGGEDNCTVTNNTVWNCTNGIYLSSSNNNTFTNNTASNNTNRGIYLYSSSYNTISGGTINDNGGTGVYIDGGGEVLMSSNTVSGNTISGNDKGVYLSSEDLTVIEGNTITGNTWGAYLDSSGANTIYNNLFNNTNNAYDDGTDDWNTTKQTGTNIINGSYLGGNFWAYPNGTGFSEDCIDADIDGICDSGLNITGGSNVDYLPLTEIPTQWTLPDVVVPSIPENATDNCGGVNFTDENVPQTIVDQMGVTGYGCFATTNGTTPAVNISVTVSTEPLSGASAGGSTAVPGFYYQINVSDSSWFDNVTMVQLRIYYNISTITLPSGVSESALRAMRYTSGLWVRLNSATTLADGTEVFAAGVVTSSQSATPYVWANLSHFSVYGVSGTVATSGESLPSGGSCRGVLSMRDVSVTNAVPGETATLSMTIENTGSCTANGVIVRLSSLPPGWSANSTTVDVDESVTVDLGLEIPASEDIGSKTITIELVPTDYVGAVSEDFEVSVVTSWTPPTTTTTTLPPGTVPTTTTKAPSVTTTTLPTEAVPPTDEGVSPTIIAVVAIVLITAVGVYFLRFKNP